MSTLPQLLSQESYNIEAISKYFDLCNRGSAKVAELG